MLEVGFDREMVVVQSKIVEQWSGGNTKAFPQTDVDLVPPSNETNDSILKTKYTWRVLSMNSKSLFVEVNFEQTLAVSDGQVKDKLLFMFRNKQLFRDKKLGRPIKN